MLVEKRKKLKGVIVFPIITPRTSADPELLGTKLLQKRGPHSIIHRFRFIMNSDEGTFPGNRFRTTEELEKFLTKHCIEWKFEHMLYILTGRFTSWRSENRETQQKNGMYEQSIVSNETLTMLTNSMSAIIFRIP